MGESNKYYWCKYNTAVDCSDSTLRPERCKKCGWNPEECKRRERELLNDSKAMVEQGKTD